MRIRAPVGDARHQDILELEPLLRRVVGARVRDPDTADDLVQEALARALAARERLDDEAVTPMPSSPPATWSSPWPGSRSGAGATGRAWST
jgi:DNA-directed RNA polymerase specialized sigma24 family protein